MYTATDSHNTILTTGSLSDCIKAVAATIGGSDAHRVTEKQAVESGYRIARA